jgi:hypothetical protein
MIFNCGVILTHYKYKYICIFTLTTFEDEHMSGQNMLVVILNKITL